METKLNKLIEAKCCTREEDVWLSHECQNVREGIEETAAAAATTETTVIGGRQRVSMRNMRPTLEPVLSSYPVLWSCTVHQG